jgi:NADPH2:quinone reductase
VKDATGGKGADLILDMVGGDYTERNHDAAAVEGRIVQIATQRGYKVQINLLKIMQKRLTHTGSTLRPRSNADKSMIARDLEAKAWPFLAGGKIKPVIDSTFALKDAPKAHARIDSGAHIGKIVLETGR